MVEVEMNTTRRINIGAVMIALPAAAIGGLVALLLTNAIPRMMKRIMAGMMENMRDQMKAGGCQPDEI